MKCFVRQHKLAGGAPWSIYEYLKVLKNEGYSIVDFVQPVEDNVLKTYTSEFGAPTKRKDFRQLCVEGNFIKAWNELLFELKTIEIEKPDLILAQGATNAFFYSYICEKMGVPLVIIIPGGDLSSQQYLVSKWVRFGNIICFSEENKDVIQKALNGNNVHVISNRISLKSSFGDFDQHYSLAEPESINILIVSRIVKYKLQSVYKLLNRLSLSDFHARIKVRIAGAGDKMKEFQRCVAEKYSDKIIVEILGHVNELVPEFEWAHIICGKGRSVIEPIMMNRIGCVIGEDGKSSVCTLRSFENLFHYNFAGRNISEFKGGCDIINVIKSLAEGSYDSSELARCVDMVKKYYSAEYLKDRFMRVVAHSQIEYGKVRPKLFPRVVSFFFAEIKHRIGALIHE